MNNRLDKANDTPFVISPIVQLMNNTTRLTGFGSDLILIEDLIKIARLWLSASEL